MWSIFADGNDVDQYYTWIKPKTRMYATECALIPCVQIYNSALGTSANSLGNGVTTSFNDRVIAEYDTYKHNDTGSFALNGDVDNSAGSWLEPSSDEFGNEAYHIPLDHNHRSRSFWSPRLLEWYRIVPKWEVLHSIVSQARARTRTLSSCRTSLLLIRRRLATNHFIAAIGSPYASSASSRTRHGP
jgi:hypothetical protein